MELLEMPETFILYRFFFEWLDERQGIGVSHWRKCWKACMTTLSELDKELDIHDFRIVEGPTHTNILFDCVVPYHKIIQKKKY